jgi:small subunit ribosomal protein S21
MSYERDSGRSYERDSGRSYERDGGRSYDRNSSRRSFDSGQLRPLEVVVDGNIDRALKILKREMGKEGILKVLKQKRFYEKPSEAKKRKQREAVRRRRRTERRRTDG